MNVCGVNRMEQLLRMGTYPRHNHLVSSFFVEVGHLFKKKKVYPLQENCFLVHFGKKYSGEERLVDASAVPDLTVLDELEVVQPDFLLFQRNKFVQTSSTLRTAGIPDLVVEVWSKSNDKYEREMKFRIYSSSPMCEHWYLTQDSNVVECFKGTCALPSQDLSRVLKSTGGLEFDLTHMAQ